MPVKSYWESEMFICHRTTQYRMGGILIAPMLDRSSKVVFASMLFVILSFSNGVLASQPPVIRSSGVIRYTPVGTLRGVARYGLDVNPAWYHMNLEDFDFMISTFPTMNFMVLPCAVPTLMPNAANADYNAIDDDNLQIIRDYVSWCKQKNIRILISNYWAPNDMWTNPERGQAVKEYWQFFASEFKGETTIAGFDLINEPWGISGASETLVSMYEEIIDAIREIDQTRTCYVQSYVKHHVGLGWVRTNPVKRDNIVYVHHLYSNKWTTGEWYTSDYTHPWSKYYLTHEYTKANEVLIDGESPGLGLYQRFGFVKKELGLPVAITEIAFLDTPEGLQYGKDVLDILNEWGINWAYHHWGTPADRRMTLLKNNWKTLRNQAMVVKDEL